MRQVKIVTDSCSDMDKEMRERFNVDYLKMNTVYEGKETPASLDWEYYSPKELYDVMRKGDRVLTTQVPMEEFITKFSEWAKEGFDVVYIGCCTKQSGSVNTGAVAAREVKEKYPDCEIFCIDSLNACVGEAVLAIKAAEMRDKGLSAEEITKEIMAIRNNVQEFITVHSLDALKKAGRVKASAAFFGNLLGVKPILISDVDGNQTPIKKVKGRKTSLQELVNLTKENIIDPENQIVFVVHADSEIEATEVAEMVKAEIPCKEVHVSYIGPIIGASIGPDAIGIWSFGKNVTFKAE